MKRRTPIRPGRPPQRRAALSRSSSPIARSTVRAVNPARKASTFARCYGSRARVRFVKHLPCCYCVALSPFFGRTDGSSHNAHTVGDGASRKAGYETIAPLCASHHRAYDEHQPPFDTEAARQYVKNAAVLTDHRWNQQGAAA